MYCTVSYLPACAGSGICGLSCQSAIKCLDCESNRQRGTGLGLCCASDRFADTLWKRTRRASMKQETKQATEVAFDHVRKVSVSDGEYPEAQGYLDAYHAVLELT